MVGSGVKGGEGQNLAFPRAENEAAWLRIRSGAGKAGYMRTKFVTLQHKYAVSYQLDRFIRTNHLKENKSSCLERKWLI